MNHWIERPRAITVLASTASTCEGFLVRLPIFVVGILAALLGFLKSGLFLQEPRMWNSDSWPQPTAGGEPLSYGFRAVGFFLDLQSYADYHLLSLIVVTCAVVFIAWAIQSELSGNSARWAAVIFTSGPWAWVLIGELGRVDALMLAGAAVLGIKGRSLSWALIGIFLMLLGNPEQAVVATTSLALLSLTPAMQAWRRGSLFSMFVAVFTWAGLWIWARNLGVSGRGDLLIPNLKDSLELFFLNLPLVLYSGFGLMALLVMWAIADSFRSARVLVVLAALVIPITVTMVTLDQTRVLVAVSTASLAALTIRYSPEIYDYVKHLLRYPLTLLVLFVVLLPAIEVVYPGKIRTPWEFYYSYLVSWGDRFIW
jgi:hypothetical protein